MEILLMSDKAKIPLSGGPQLMVLWHWVSVLLKLLTLRASTTTLFCIFVFVFKSSGLLAFVSACHSLMNAMKARSFTIPSQTPTFKAHMK